jgi:hypothetical protein
MARPTKCTPALTKLVCKELEQGMPLEPAANAQGIADSTLYEWLDKGLQEIQPYAAFTDAVVRARGIGELRLLRTVLKGDTAGRSFGKAKSAAWVVEKTRRQRYGQQVALKEQDQIRVVLEVVRGICSKTDFDRICTRLDEIDRTGSAGVPEGDPGERTDLH